MGLTLSSLITRCFGKKHVKVLMIGLDCAGKSTILYKLKLGEIVTTIPTIGFNVESVEYKNVSFVVWDIGGQSKMRPLWHHYFRGTEGVIFVIDSNDKERIKSAAEELNYIITDEELKDVAVLIFANKQDLPNAMSISEIIEKLNMKQAQNIRWFIQAGCAIRSEGLYEGLEWLSNEIAKKNN